MDTGEQERAEAITAAILVSLLRQGAPADLLECLTYGIDRYLPPNALRKAVDHALVWIAREKRNAR